MIPDKHHAEELMLSLPATRRVYRPSKNLVRTATMKEYFDKEGDNCSEERARSLLAPTGAAQKWLFGGGT